MAITITKSNVPAQEKLHSTAKSRERDTFQTEMDGEIKTLVEGWRTAEVAAGTKLEDGKTPADGHAKVSEANRPKARYHVSPDDKKEFKDVLRRAATLHKVEVVFLYPEGQNREPVDEKTGKAAVTVTVGPRSAVRKH